MKEGSSAAELASRLNALDGQIPELKEIRAGTDFSATDASWDVGLYTVFADKAGLEAYRVHPKHQEVIAFVKENTTDRAVVDWEG